MSRVPPPGDVPCVLYTRWPKSYGVGYSGADYSDLHHLRASDWNVNSARSNLYFGICSNVECNSPAHDEAAADTAKNSVLFQPPAAVRGDSARAMFYMAVRYDGSDSNTEDLELSDCPCPYIYTMGNLTSLRRWHEEDPVDEDEQTRNDNVCSLYQGNRNPFVDYPTLVSSIWDSSDYPADALPCSVCNEAVPTAPPSIAPTAVPTTLSDFISTDRANLFISMYGEGSSYNKWLQLKNGGNATADLSDYEIMMIRNGGDWAEDSIALSGALAPGAQLLVCHSSADLILTDVADLASGSASWNGDDAVGLAHDGVLIDTVGRNGSDPGIGWSVCGVSSATVDHMISRKASVASGNPDWGSSAGTDTDDCEWLVFPSDIFFAPTAMPFPSVTPTPLPTAQPSETFLFVPTTVPTTVPTATPILTSTSLPTAEPLLL